MEKFIRLESTGVPLPIEDVDTDQIIPARFLKATTREGFGDQLFRDWRYNSDGSLKENFILNDSTYTGKVLIAGKNFGCGSSREHAAWAIYDFGFRVVISSFFADIFKNNALNNGLLPLMVTDKVLSELFSLVQNNPQALLTVDLERQELLVPDLSLTVPFEINPYKKACMINGYDDIDFLLSLQSKVEVFEQSRS